MHTSAYILIHLCIFSHIISAYANHLCGLVYYVSGCDYNRDIEKGGVRLRRKLD